MATFACSRGIQMDEVGLGGSCGSEEHIHASAETYGSYDRLGVVGGSSLKVGSSWKTLQLLELSLGGDTPWTEACTKLPCGAESLEVEGGKT